MGENSKIEWCDSTWNPWIGCTKVSLGCANCYAEELMANRYKRVQWGKGAQRQRTSDNNWNQPLIWNAKALILGTNPKVFCASLSDWLDDEVPIQWLADLLKLIHRTPQLNWLLLSKRPENWRKRLWELHEWIYDVNPLLEIDYRETRWRAGDWVEHGSYPENVWIGVSVENQEMANKRIPEVLNIPARIRFLSVEPMLGPIEFSDVTSRADAVTQLGKKSLEGIHQVICGGESGRNKRPMNIEWARSLRDQCKAASVAFFMKQIDKVKPIPDDLMVRQFPNQN